MDNARILVIDDEIGICEGIRRALAPQGLSVDIATSGAEGMQKIQSGGYDLTLLDIMMPGVSGIDLIAEIHRHDPEIVCIIITGYATVELAVQAIKQGAYDFLTKPFSVDDLSLAVNHGLERRRLSLEARRLQAIEAEARRLNEEKARLEELDKAKRQFIRLVTHEMQAPVAAIQNYLQLILDGYVPPENQPEIITKCIARAQEEMDLIADLLELGQLQVLAKPVKPVPVHLEELLVTVMDNFREQAARKNLRLDLNLAPDLPPVMGAPERFKSVWTNLISNAVKYTPPGGAVTVSLRVEAGNIIGVVSDTGIGIPAGEQAHLFSEFFRATNAKELDLPGTGLGLAIVRQIIAAAGGKISVESESGRGARFIFSLPAHFQTESQ
ncbi:MAG: hybrid sensor histidine kinase/response regulator [Anaerolineales bacterium]|nr:hybrid sensor histidine kinase/response regulator [Anaerolineales bacterium]